MSWLWWGLYAGALTVAIIFGLVGFIDLLNYMDLQRRLREQREKADAV